MINYTSLENKVFNNFASLANIFQQNIPFPHIVIDNFLDQELAHQLDTEFLSENSKFWYKYNNAIENKKSYNHWEAFPKWTYRFFSYLNSQEFIDKLQKLFTNTKLFADIGLNGGGWHLHANGGKLNAHLDYSIHPKLNLERKLNIILYINENWQEEWGGMLGLWNHNKITQQPDKLVKKIYPKFNRAVIFDTTCNSWHGLCETVHCPQNQARCSLAVYYLSIPQYNASTRTKALFAPTEAQKNDSQVLELIKKRSQESHAEKVYKD